MIRQIRHFYFQAHCGNQDGSNPNNQCEEEYCQCDVNFANDMRRHIMLPYYKNNSYDSPTINPGCSDSRGRIRNVAGTIKMSFTILDIIFIMFRVTN